MQAVEETAPSRFQRFKIYLCKWWIRFLIVLLICGTALMAAGVAVTFYKHTVDYTYLLTTGILINALPITIFLARGCQFLRKRYLEYKGARFKPNKVPDHTIQEIYNETFMELEMDDYPLPSGTLELYKGE